MESLLSFRAPGLIPLSRLGAALAYLDSFPPLDLMLWTDGFVPLFFFGKGDSSVLANCSFCGTEANFLFSSRPRCSSFSAVACAILQAFCWSQQHQQVCHFPSLLPSDSRSVLAILSSPPTFVLFQSLADLTGTVFSLLLFYQATMCPPTLVSPGDRRG